MGNFNRGRDQSGGRSFGRPMHKTTCGKCGKECEVPFIPSGSRPVFCRDCFQNNRVSDPRRSGFEDRGSRQNFPRPERSDFRLPGFDQNKNQFEGLNAKLDKILKILEPKVAAAAVSLEAPKTPKAKKAAKKPTPHPRVI